MTIQTLDHEASDRISQGDLPHTMTAPVIVVGAGPVGLVAAMDLAWRGVPVILLEQRSDTAPAHPRCNTTSARTMEILRRLGCHAQYRASGLRPDDRIAWRGKQLPEDCGDLIDRLRGAALN